MASLIIKINKEDISTVKLGHNIHISCQNNIDLIFTIEAIEELINDYKEILIRERLAVSNKS